MNVLPVLSSNRTYGVEIEALWPSGVSPENIRKFNVTTDGSIATESGFYGYEVQCGVFSGNNDLATLFAYIDNERSKGLRVNVSCGGHVHVGVIELSAMSALERIGFLYRLYENFVAIEDELYAINGGDSRRNSRYAKSVKERFQTMQGIVNNNSFSLELGDRYQALNVASLMEHKTVEFRIFRATINPYAWVENVAIAIKFIELTLAGTAITSLAQLGVNMDNFAAIRERFRSSAIQEEVKALRLPYGKVSPDTANTFKTVRKFMRTIPVQSDRDKAYLFLREICARSTNQIVGTDVGLRSTRQYYFIQLEPTVLATIHMHIEGTSRKVELTLPNRRPVTIAWDVE